MKRRRAVLLLLCGAIGAACSPRQTAPPATPVPTRRIEPLPDAAPTVVPTTGEPTVLPTTGEPTVKPTTGEPTGAPTTGEPTAAPTAGEPTAAPMITPSPIPGPVLVGVDVLMRDRLDLLRRQRLGLVTNATGRTRDGRSTIDVLHAESSWRLVALFSPEHGIRGEAAAGQSVGSSVDQRTGLPIYSLYGDTTRPTDAMLTGVDTLVYDIQDVGARPYTYTSTLLEVMRAAVEHGLRVVVLDRPNPIGGDQVEGNVLDPRFASFVGPAPIAMRYGLTIGELGRLFNADLALGTQLTVVPLQGWLRTMWFDQTGLSWLNPSPNIRSLSAAALYPGTVLVEGSNLSEGRGTPRPFEWIGAPFLDGQGLADALNSMALPGVRFTASDQTPETSKFAGQACHGVAIEMVDRLQLRPMELGVSVLAAARAVAGGHVQLLASTFDALAGTDQVRRAIEAARPVEEIVTAWQPDLDRFRSQREKYLLYR